MKEENCNNYTENGECLAELDITAVFSYLTASPVDLGQNCSGVTPLIWFEVGAWDKLGAI